ncbi:MAG: TetR/AcrR family transcriptional regulator [Ketobacteraceae bacterium]|nr:TetR/AcrR family transcriptional regulator [Ketobacteraceae bacterium]
MTQRKSREDWINAGIDTLKTKGPQALSAEKLAKKLGVTRGSFYHHFENIHGFNTAILDHWVNVNTTIPFAEAKTNTSTPEDELEQLVEKSWHTDLQLEVAVRAWAMTNQQVRQWVETSDKYRLEYLIGLYQAVVGDKEKGKRFAQIAFYGLLGAIHAQPKMAEEKLGELIREIQNLMMTSLK